MITIDGQNGGGQILRSALSLSLMTAQPFHMINIRGKRHKSGLKRQHLACVLAALEVGNGSADGAELLSEELIFHPGEVKAGDYHIQIGSAGSTALVAQTLIPALANLADSSTLTIEGGTHAPMAPSYHFLAQHFLPAINQMGFPVSAELVQTGFAPVGGGCLKVAIGGKAERTAFQSPPVGELQATRAIFYHYELAGIIETIQKLLSKKNKDLTYEIIECPEAPCPGLTVQLESTYQHPEGRYAITSEIMAEHTLRSQTLVAKLLKAHQTKHAIGTSVDHRVADQLMLYLAQVPNSELITGPITNHLRTNAEVINAFLPNALKVEIQEDGKIRISS